VKDLPLISGKSFTLIEAGPSCRAFAEQFAIYVTIIRPHKPT
jgi:hypothetical protein